ncbi:hypothetical protein ATANTOWER_016079 [Ataeniobius toweri]|uniref:Uncharacterized protein n=1 Tax=Ataeniobius toweri TaxID=208326 RepID=A0ABU7AHW2_9TELE|nr:hypothetical protein [Ataeniobius toweri]
MMHKKDHKQFPEEMQIEDMNHVRSTKTKRLYLKLPLDDGAPRPISKAATLQRKLTLAPCIWNLDLLVMIHIS